MRTISIFCSCITPFIIVKHPRKIANIFLNLKYHAIYEVQMKGRLHKRGCHWCGIFWTTFKSRLIRYNIFGLYHDMIPWKIRIVHKDNKGDNQDNKIESFYIFIRLLSIVLLIPCFIFMKVLLRCTIFF